MMHIQKIFALFIFMIFYSYQVFGMDMLYIDDSNEDVKISTKYLPKYITEIYKSRNEFLKGKTFTLNENEGTFTFTYEKIQFIGKNFSNSLFFAEEFNNFIKKSHTFFTNPSFFSIQNEELNLKIEIDNPFHLIYFYVKAAEYLSETFIDVCQMRFSLKHNTGSLKSILLFKSILAIKEDILGDLAKIIHVIRPYLPKGKIISNSENVLALISDVKSVTEKLRLIAIEERIYQWTEILPELKMQLQKKEILDSITIDEEPKKIEPTTSHVGTQASLESTNLHAIPLVISLQAVSQVSKPKEVKQKLKREDKKKPGSKGDAKAVGSKQKTRPSEEQEFLQNLNGFFEDDSFATVSEKIKQDLASKIKNENSNSNSNSNLKETSKRHLNSLHTLLSSENLGAIDVEDTLKMLSYFGILESTPNGHYKLKAGQTLGVWLKGKRILLEIDTKEENENSEVTTFSVRHKSGGEKYFTRRSITSIRNALLKAGFDKLLK